VKITGIYAIIKKKKKEKSPKCTEMEQTRKMTGFNQHSCIADSAANRHTINHSETRTN
jgi:hypothetical protein